MTFTAAGLDDDRADEPSLFLKTRVRVIPVSARLIHREAIREGAAAGDAVETETRYTIHVRRQNETVPVDRTGGGQAIRDPNRHHIALTHSQQWTGQLSVHDRGNA